MNKQNYRWMRRATPADVEPVKAAAHADNHEVIALSHVMTKGGEMIGAGSLAQVPLVLPWFDTQKCKARDTMYFINQAENMIAELLPNVEMFCVPFAEKSPFVPHIEQIGFVNAGKFYLTFKKVR